MSSMKNLQLLLAVLLPLAALGNLLPGYSAPGDVPEISGEELQDSTGAFEHHKWLSIARILHRDITRLRDEQFQRDFGEPVANMTNYASVRSKTPLISPSDGCYSKNFSAQRCLRRIYAGLSTYREYLSKVERENLTAAQVTDIKLRTTSLLNIIKEKVDDAPIQPHSVSELPDGSAWTQRTVTHSILYNLEVFLKETSRAINFINKKLGNHIRKEIKESKWPSEKHSQE
ncbi:interleukin-6 [Colossoma macropomum]|uniref:interleukin-6 n=1 Tax=Colossoma macropomum TaxID=42526 RepID=UPI0018647DC1|nr:interleukin-6 [Colossoma macropomum]